MNITNEIALKDIVSLQKLNCFGLTSCFLLIENNGNYIYQSNQSFVSDSSLFSKYPCEILQCSFILK